MMRIAGVLVLLIAIYVALGIVGEIPPKTDTLGTSNLIDVANRQGMTGVITIGVAVLIITGAIDLSIGSVIAFSAVAFGVMTTSGISILGIRTGAIHPFAAVPIVLVLGALIGLVNGLLVTRLKLQAFLVTLCGLFVYRGLARYMSGTTSHPGINSTILKENPSFKEPLNELRYALIGKDFGGVLQFPMQMVVFLVITIVVGIILHKSVVGRYWYAIGHNESAARYAGISTNRYRLIGFVISSFLASLCGVMWLLDYGEANPTNAGDMWELYAITGAVLGGCSLRGGEGTIIGAFLGAMVLPVLRNLISFMSVPDAIIPAVIGLTLLFGTLADEFFRRRSALRK
jgi:ribose transport system permease protein